MVETNTEIKYNIPFEVTKKQYDACMGKCAGLLCGRFDEPTGKYFLKVWHPKYSDYITNILKQNI
jgi:hypothetical protein